MEGPTVLCLRAMALQIFLGKRKRRRASQDLPKKIQNGVRRDQYDTVTATRKSPSIPKS